MLKMLLTATLSCSKKIFGALVTCAVRFVSWIQRAAATSSKFVTDSVHEFASHVKKPNAQPNSEGSSFWKMCKGTVKAVLLQRFLLFLGGFVCVFLFPEESRGDLTWFETVVKSSRDMAKNIGLAAVDDLSNRFCSLFSRKVVT